MSVDSVLSPGVRPGIISFRTLPALIAEGVLLLAHIILSSPLDLALLCLVAFPAAYAAMSSGRSAMPLLLLPSLALADDIIDADTLALLAEIAILGVIMLGGARLAHLVDEERSEHDRVYARTLQRATRLKDPTGYWTTVARTRTGVYVTGIEERFIREAMRGHPGGVVLDVGASSGRLEDALAEYAEHVIATDLDREEIYAMHEDERVTPIVVSAQPGLPVRDASINVVSAIEAPAASDEDWFREESARVLATGGGVIVTAFNARSYKGLIARALRRGRSPWARLYYQKSLSRQVRLWREAGFDVVRKRGFYWSPLPRNADSRWVDGWSALERLLGLRALTALSPWVMLELRKRD